MPPTHYITHCGFGVGGARTPSTGEARGVQAECSGAGWWLFFVLSHRLHLSFSLLPVPGSSGRPIHSFPPVITGTKPNRARHPLPRAPLVPPALALHQEPYEYIPVRDTLTPTIPVGKEAPFLTPPPPRPRHLRHSLLARALSRVGFRRFVQHTRFSDLPPILMPPVPLLVLCRPSCRRSSKWPGLRPRV